MSRPQPGLMTTGQPGSIMRPSFTIVATITDTVEPSGVVLELALKAWLDYSSSVQVRAASVAATAAGPLVPLPGLPGAL